MSTQEREKVTVTLERDEARALLGGVAHPALPEAKSKLHHALNYGPPQVEAQPSEPKPSLDAVENAIWGAYREHSDQGVVEDEEPENWPEWLIAAALAVHGLDQPDPQPSVEQGVVEEDRWTQCPDCGFSLAEGHRCTPPIDEMLPDGAECPRCGEPMCWVYPARHAAVLSPGEARMVAWFLPDTDAKSNELRDRLESYAKGTDHAQ